MGRGSLPSDHPNLGSLGRRYGLVKSDTVILIGTPIDFRLSYGEDRLFPQNPKLIEIMMDGNKIGQNRDVDVGVTGDIGAVLGQVLDGLDASGYKSPGKAWVEEVITEDRALKAADEELLLQLGLDEWFVGGGDDDTVVVMLVGCNASREGEREIVQPTFIYALIDPPLQPTHTRPYTPSTKDSQ